MQPRRPQVQRAPSITTTMWPISPAPPRPRQGGPSRITPPPTPVPQNTPSSERNGRPAPRWNSAAVATWTSLPISTSGPSAFFRVSASGKVPSQSGRFRALVTVPSSITPGEPTPTPASAPASTAASAAASRIVSAIAAATAGGPPSVGVGLRDEPSTSWESSTTTAWIFVPPRSIPPKVGIGGHDRRPGVPLGRLD